MVSFSGATLSTALNLRDTFSTASMMLCRIFVQVVTLILLSRLLLPPDFGMLTLVQVLGAMFGIFVALGSPYILLRAAADDIEDFSASIVLLLIRSTVIGIVVIPFACVIGVLALGVVSKIILIISLLICEVLLLPLVTVVLSAYQAVNEVNVSQRVQLCFSVMRLLGVLALYMFELGDPLKSYVILYAVISLVYVLIVLNLGRKKFELKFSRVSIRRLLNSESGYGLKNMIMHLTSVVTSDADKVLAARAYGDFDLGLYSSASRIFGAMTAPLTALLLNAYPSLFRQRKNMSESASHIARLVPIVVFLGCALGLLLVTSSGFFYSLLGAAYSGGNEYLSALGFALPLVFLRHFCGVLLVALERPLVRVVLDLSALLVFSTGVVVFQSQFGRMVVPYSMILGEFSILVVGLISLCVFFLIRGRGRSHV